MDARAWHEPVDQRVLCEAKPLARGAVLWVRGGGALVFVHAGTVWLTQDGDPLDHVLQGGQWRRIERDQPVCIEALRPATLSVSAPLAAWDVEIFRPNRERSFATRLARNTLAWWLRLQRFGRRAAAARAMTTW
jgi:hypothetical protein